MSKIFLIIEKKQKGLLWLIIMLAALNISYSHTDTLTLENCVNLALKNNPQMKIAEGAFNSSEALYISTKSVLYPQLFFQSGWTKNGGTFFFGPTSRSADYENYLLGFQMQQLLYDFGKSYSRVSAAEDLKNASKEDMLGAKQNLILTTHIAYFNLLQSKRIAETARVMVSQAVEHERQAKAIFNVGKNSRYDVLKAETDIANANVNLLAAENNYRISVLQLKNILNTGTDYNFEIHDNLEIGQDSIDINIAVQTALNSRNEVKASKFLIEANKSTVTSAWAANLPTLSAAAGYNWRSYSISEPFLSTWNLSVNFSVPVFQGFAVNASVDHAHANLKTAEASLDLISQSVILEVQQQYSSLQEAKERIKATGALVKQVEETLRLAESRFREGVGSPLEITDARTSLYNAKTAYIQSLYNYQVTNVRLIKAIGILR